MHTREQWARLIHTEPHRIGHLVGFRDLTPLHSEWLRSFLFCEEDQTLLAHRGSYKTTDLSLAMALLVVWQPNRNIMFFRKTDTDVSEIIKQTSAILKTEYMQVMIQDLYGGIDFRFTKDTSSEISTNLRTSIRGASQVLGLGIKTSITGKHADIVITDDIVNIKDRVSKAEREETKRQYMELQNIRNRGGRIINTGTPWHKEDAIAFMPNVTRYDCYQTGLISRGKLEKIRGSMTDSLFAANYELKHIADQDVMFKEPKFTNVEELIYDGVAHIDAAYGGEDGTAYTILKLRPDGTLIGFGKLWKKHVDDCISELRAYHSRFRAGSISCEDNADKGYLKKELRGLGFLVNGYHEDMNKFLKISTYLRQHWADITWLEETDPEYINEILDYNEDAAHDDAPDSAASLIRRIFGKASGKLKTFKGGI